MERVIKPKVGVIIANIGTPNSTSISDVRQYLREFLMDPFVIDISYWLRFILVQCIIAPFRSKKSAKAYKKIWTKEGSPLLVETRKFAKELQDELGSEFQVEVGMRYGQPSMKNACEALKNCESLVLFPQYPQYAESSTRSSIDRFHQLVKKMGHWQKSSVVPPFYKNQGYIKTIVNKLNKAREKKPADYLLFSYHGLPERHLTKIDPQKNHCGHAPACCEDPGASLKCCYRAQARQTTEAIAKAMDLKKGEYGFSFQSRLGRQVWISPYTDKVLPELAGQHKSIIVTCPSFVADCLETLEEIAMEAKQDFLEAGGENFTYVPCVNSDPDWVQSAKDLVVQSLS